MSDTALYLSLGIVFAAVAAILIYVILGKRSQRQNKGGYRWKPEQDYDVIMRGETPMTPGFPTMVKRDKSKPNQNRKYNKLK